MSARAVTGGPDRSGVAWVAVVLVVVTLAAYARVGGHEFVTFDDGEYVAANPHVQGGPTRAALAWAFTSFHSSNWHPLTWFAHMLDCALFGLDAGAHHLVSAGLHALNAALCFLFLRAATRTFWPSALVAALFALHPLRVQSVAWISERKDLLAGLFFFLGLLAYLRYARRPSAGRYAAVAAALATGLLAKPTLVTFPLVLLLLDRWPLARFHQASAGRLILEKLPLVLLVAASSVVTVVAQRSSGALGSFETLGLDARLSNALVALVTYLGRTLWPAGLAYFHPHPALVDPIWSPWNAGALGAGVLLVALTALALHQRRRRPFLAVGWLWFVVMLLPMIGLVQVGEQSWAERYAYLPLIGIYLALVWSAAELWAARPAWRRPLVVAAGAALLACGLQTWVHTAFWRNSEALYRRALAVTERNYMAHIGLANTLARAGDRAGARREYEAAFAIRDDFPTLLFDLGLFHQDEGDLARALELYERALALYPQYLVARLNLAAVRHRMGDLDGALAESELLLAQEPDQPDANYNAALVLAQRDDLERAREHLLRAVRARPDFSQARQLLGRIEEAAGRRAEALRHLRIACSSEPLPAEAATWLAWILSTAPENELRDGVEALGWADRAVAATGGRDPAALEARAAALAQLRRFDEAAAVQERAVDLAPPGARAELLERLELYRRRKPFRTER